jgi:hypothetical protein
MSAGTLYTTSEVEGKRVRYAFMLYANLAAILYTNCPRYKQIRAIAAFAGLSVEVNESTSDIVKTPTFKSRDGFSVFEASAIGRYSESSYFVQQGESPPRTSQGSSYFVQANDARWNQSDGLSLRSFRAMILGLWGPR